MTDDRPRIAPLAGSNLAFDRRETPAYNRAVEQMSDAERWTERALEQLADAGYRRGGARRELLTLLGEQRCALSPLEIEEALAGGDRRVSRASIYRILEELEQIGVVQRVEVGAGISRFEPVRHGRGHHHHLVCDRCGRLEPFSDEGLERAIKRLSERVPLEVSEHEVVLHGSCGNCAA
jgi:Fur family transcriptional regulator, ferric uptake regulator